MCRGNSWSILILPQHFQAYKGLAPKERQAGLPGLEEQRSHDLCPVSFLAQNLGAQKQVRQEILAYLWWAVSAAGLFLSSVNPTGRATARQPEKCVRSAFYYFSSPAGQMGGVGERERDHIYRHRYQSLHRPAAAVSRHPVATTENC